ncbi:hypothetical protein ACNR9Q_10200 [Maribacter sp. X9]|uniref:hypothetical protein n=1 Tax=Maribacter sp. X9 TaxID=3402159 RepID=UPI003AF37770
MKQIKFYCFITLLLFLTKSSFGQEEKDSIAILKSKLERTQKEFNLLQESTSPEEKIHLDFVGTGNLQASIADADEVQGSAGLGVIYERFFGLKKPLFRSYDIEAFINVASTVDTLKATLNDESQVTNQRLFGAYIINPISTKQSIYVNSNVYFNPDGKMLFNKIAKFISGVNLRLISSNALWQFDNNTNKNLGVLAFRYGVFHEFLPDDKIRDRDGKRKYSVFLGFNLTHRGIVGDLSSETNDDLRNSFLGTTDFEFSGIEPNFGFRLNNIIAEFTMPSLGGSRKSDIEGLTDTQFLFSIRFVGGFSLKFDADEAKKDDTSISEEGGL